MFDLPVAHSRHLRTTNGPERLSEQIKRRTRVARLFPSKGALLRLVGAGVAEISEEWESGKAYLNMKNAESAEESFLQNRCCLIKLAEEVSHFR